MTLIQGGSDTAGVANVTATYDLQVRTPTDQDDAGFVVVTCEKDSGVVTGAPLRLSPEISTDYRTRVGTDQTMFNLSFEGTTVAQAHIQQNVTTMTNAQASGFLAMNNGLATANGNFSHTRTYRTFPLFGSYPTYGEFWIREGNPTSTNSVSEWGFGYVSGATATPTDGVMFRRIAGGQLYAVLNFGGAEPSNALITETNIPSRDGSGAYDATECNHYVIVVANDIVRYWINDALVASIKVPSNAGSPTQSQTQPLFARVYNSGVASAARQVSLGFLNVSLGDMNASKPWSHIVNGGGGGSYQTQPGNASGPTVLRTAATNGWPASTTAKTSGTWTATSAPASNDLGGRWLTPAISTLTSEADYPVFAYLNPAGTATLPGKTLYITTLRVGDCIAQAAASTNAITLFLAAAVGSTAAATTTADAAAAVGPRIVPLGAVGFGSTAAIGDMRNGWTVDFTHGPLVVPPGTYFHFIVRPVGTVASNTLVVAGTLTVVGYFE